MEAITIALDVVLIGAAVWMVISIRDLGGEIGKSLGIVSVGFVVLGAAHIIETLTLAITPVPEDLNEIIHRLIVLTGFVLLVIGFNRISRLK